MTQSNPYIPSRGDIVYLDFDPTKGHEQKGLRPAFVLSPRAYIDTLRSEDTEILRTELV